jgi:hypothetical protein
MFINDFTNECVIEVIELMKDLCDMGDKPNAELY